MNPFNDKYLAALIGLFLVFYGGFASPELPPVIKRMYTSVYFRIIMLALVGFTVNRNIVLSVLLATALTISLVMVEEYDTSGCGLYCQTRRLFDMRSL